MKKCNKCSLIKKFIKLFESKYNIDNLIKNNTNKSETNDELLEVIKENDSKINKKIIELISNASDFHINLPYTCWCTCKVKIFGDNLLHFSNLLHIALGGFRFPAFIRKKCIENVCNKEIRKILIEKMKNPALSSITVRDYLPRTASADIIAFDFMEYYQTILHLAVNRSDIEIVKLILEKLYPQLILLKNSSKMSALDLAKKEGYEEIVELIKNKVFNIYRNINLKDLENQLISNRYSFNYMLFENHIMFRNIEEKVSKEEINKIIKNIKEFLKIYG